MPAVIEVRLLDRPRDRSEDRLPLQDLEGRDLLDNHHPDALFGEPSRIGIAPKDLLRPLLEPGIQASRLPVAGAMGLKTPGVQVVSPGPWPVWGTIPSPHALPGPATTRPIAMCQPFGEGS